MIIVNSASVVFTMALTAPLLDGCLALSIYDRIVCAYNTTRFIAWNRVYSNDI